MLDRIRNTRWSPAGLAAIILLIAAGASAQVQLSFAPADTTIAPDGHGRLSIMVSDTLEIRTMDCMDCHNLNDYSGGLALDLMDHDTIIADAEVWEKVGGYCDIEEWAGMACEVTSGDGGVADLHRARAPDPERTRGA